MYRYRDFLQTPKKGYLMKTMFKNPIFWILFTSISLLCFAYTFKFFPTAFPIVNIDITIDRDQAIEIAKQKATTYNWGPHNPSIAVSFDSDSQAQTFVELAGGGQDTFREMIKEHYYMPYTWHVRQFKEFEKNETHIYLTPQGKLYGFREKISEDEERPSLSHKDALALVMRSLQDDLHINTTPYKLVEDAKNTRLNGRVDRNFVFERSDITLNEGRYRIKTKVRGDTLTQVKQCIKIPQSFTLTYKEMRSTNTAIASAASIFAFIFYLLIGCFLGIFILMRHNWILWVAPVKWAFLIAILQFLNTLNSMPLMWMYYQTQTGKYGFLLHVIVSGFSSFVMTFITTSLIFIAAEGLTRKAFGKHIRLWDNWNPHIANSYTLLGHTIGGYLMIGIDMAFLVTFYYISTTYFQWWAPLSKLVDPNVLASYVPWLSSIAKSLQAGFVEEAQFRVIPLASAALLGERFGKKKWWIGGALILQAIVFGAAHANYAAQPAYARLVELILPSFVFAGLYLRFGLLTSVVMHYAYDVFWFSLPIFLSQAPGIWMNQAAVLFFTFLPLIIIFYNRFKLGSWERLHTTSFNATWHPTNIPLFEQKNSEKTIAKTISKKRMWILSASALLSCLTIFFTTRFTTDAPPLKILRSQAIEIARKQLAHEGISTETFQAYAKMKPSLEKKEDKDLAHRYIWQTYTKPIYTQLTETYLNPAHWIVKFLKFSGSQQERAESYEVLVGARTHKQPVTYEVLSWEHKIAENIPGAQLEKKEARALAEKSLTAHGIHLADVQELSAVPKQLPERIDWTFTFAHNLNESIKKGEPRIVITITGDEVAHYYTKIHLPEMWKRTEKKEHAATSALQTLCSLLIRILCLLGMCIALLFLAYKKISGHVFASSFAVFILLSGIKLLNNWPQLIAQFNTSAPFATQAFQTYGRLTLQSLVYALIFACLLSIILQIKQRYSYSDLKTSYIIGITSGLLLAATWTFISHFQPSLAPLWGYYNILGTALPSLGFLNTYLLKYLQYTAAFTFGFIVLNYITNYGKKILPPAAALCAISGLAFAGFESIDLISLWLVSGIIFGLFIYILWYYLLRYSVETVPVTIATCFVLTIAQQMFFNVLPDIIIVGIASILSIMYCAWILTRIIRKLHA